MILKITFLEFKERFLCFLLMQVYKFDVYTCQVILKWLLGAARKVSVGCLELPNKYKMTQQWYYFYRNFDLIECTLTLD